MALFVVRHQHAADHCPAQNPYVGAELLIHLSRPSAKKHGVRIQGEPSIYVCVGCGQLGGRCERIDIGDQRLRWS